MSALVKMQNDTSVAATVERVVRPLLDKEGVDLILVEFNPRSHVLRLFIDKESGVTIDDCTHTSRWIGDVLDAEGVSDSIAGAYSLEVSSPGLDRPLVRPPHYVRFVGREVRVTTEPIDFGGKPRRKFHGTLVAAEENPDAGIRVEVDGEEVAIDYASIKRTRLVPEF